MFIYSKLKFGNSKIIPFQYFQGIQRDKTIANKLMYIPNEDTQNYLLCRLKLVVETFEHLT